MKPIPFPEHNAVLQKPDTMTDEECGPLPVHRGNGMCVSCWQFTPEEIAQIQKHGKLWVFVFSGNSQPPIAFSTQKTAFEVVEEDPE